MHYGVVPLSHEPLSELPRYNTNDKVSHPRDDTLKYIWGTSTGISSGPLLLCIVWGMKSLCLEGFVFYRDKMVSEKTRGGTSVFVSALSLMLSCSLRTGSLRSSGSLPLWLRVAGTLRGGPASCSPGGSTLLRVRPGLLAEAEVAREEHSPAIPGKNWKFEASENINHKSTFICTMAT